MYKLEEHLKLNILRMICYRWIENLLEINLNMPSKHMNLETVLHEQKSCIE